jgi:hypothetical protein
MIKSNPCKECQSIYHTKAFCPLTAKKPIKRTAIKPKATKKKPTMRDVNRKLKEALRLTKQDLKVQYDDQKDKAWKAFSLYIRTRDSLATTGTTEYCVCITCEVRGDAVPKPFSSIQAGHAVGGRRNAVLFHEEIVNGQCNYCNGQSRGCLAGDYGNYAIALIKRYGIEHTEELQRLKYAYKDYSYKDLLDIEHGYKEKVSTLIGNK